ncbi:MAG: hypothetical protein Q8J76_10915, partial [Desulfobulbaceae bacterium]|nr:hypothetical protein [Desulfobulbaceae bacterium]
RRAIDQLRQSKTNPLGIVMNSTGRKQAGLEQGHDSPTRTKRALEKTLRIIDKQPLPQLGSHWLLVLSGFVLLALAFSWSLIGVSP